MKSKINIVIPKWYEYMNGFNEIVQDEIFSYVYKTMGIESIMSQEIPIEDAELYLFVAQYREECRGDWINNVIKYCNPKAIIGVCGKATTEARKYIIKNNLRINYVIKGEPEVVFCNIIKNYLENGQNIQFNNIKGIIYRDFNGNIVENSNQQCIQNYDDLPIPTFSYLSNEKKYPLCVLTSSRGCHGKCKFCEGHIVRTLNPGENFRGKSAERMVEEIKYIIDRYKRRVFCFADDNFFVDGLIGKERAYKFAKLIQKEKIRIRYTVECRADDVDYELFKELKKSGLHKVFIGIESGSQSFLDRIGKGTTVQQNINAIEILNELGIICEPGYIFFDPMTTVKELEETLKFFKKYQDKLYSLPTGSGYCRLYFPYDSEIVKQYWPNKSSNFYDKISHGQSKYIFIDETVRKIFDKYVEIIDNKEQPFDIVLKNRVNALEKAIEYVVESV